MSECKRVGEFADELGKVESSRFRNWCKVHMYKDAGIRELL